MAGTGKRPRQELTDATEDTRGRGTGAYPRSLNESCDASDNMGGGRAVVRADLPVTSGNLPDH